MPVLCRASLDHFATRIQSQPQLLQDMERVEPAACPTCSGSPSAPPGALLRVPRELSVASCFGTVGLSAFAGTRRVRMRTTNTPDPQTIPLSPTQSGSESRALSPPGSLFGVQSKAGAAVTFSCGSLKPLPSLRAEALSRPPHPTPSHCWSWQRGCTFLPRPGAGCSASSPDGEQ